MPNARERFLFVHWQHLITVDPALSKNERKVFKRLAQDAEVALARALFELGIY